MSGDQLASRLICSGANVDAQKTRTRGALKSGDFYRLFDALGPLEESSIYIDETPSIGPTERLAKLRRLRQDLRGDLGLVVGDYLQPVSYTHLDVYKRQGVDCTGADIYEIGRSRWAEDAAE